MAAEAAILDNGKPARLLGVARSAVADLRGASDLLGAIEHAGPESVLTQGGRNG